MRVPQTKRGYDFNELLSALQKDIRRGNEYEAVFWAAELESFNSSALWKRLRIIASEDIGCANPLMPILIETLHRHYIEAKQKLDSGNEWRLFLVNAVVCLCRSQKSRITDDLLNTVYAEIQYEDKKLPIPDYALDMHTLEGKKMGRGVEHFFSEGNRLCNEPFENPYTAKAEKLLTKYSRIKRELRDKETD